MINNKATSLKFKKKWHDLNELTDSAHLTCQELSLLAYNKSLQSYDHLFLAIKQEILYFDDQIQEMENQIKLLGKPTLAQSEKIKMIHHLVDQLEFICTQFKYID